MHGKECDGEKSVTKNITAPQVHNGALRETGQMENRMHGRENDSDVGRCVTEIITPLQVHNGVLREDGQEEGEEDKLRMLSDASNHKQRDEGSESESSPTKPKEEGDNATQDPQPPDGGWGWAVVFGASLISVSTCAYQAVVYRRSVFTYTRALISLSLPLSLHICVWPICFLR